MSHFFESGFFAGVSAWHGLGEVTASVLSVKDAITMSGLDWKVIQVPVQVDGHDVPGYLANVRDSDDTVLGITSDRYRPIQNVDGFDLLDFLLSRQEVLFESAGSLKGGRVVWMLARIPQDYKLLGDNLRPFLLFANSHDGSMVGVAKPVNMRVECWNKLQMALSEDGATARIRHTGNIKAKMAEAARVLGMAEQQILALQKEAEHLSRYRLSEKQWWGVVTDLVPIPEEPGLKMLKMRNDARSSLHNYASRPDLANHWINNQLTGWGAVQAVVDYVMHEPPQRTTQSWQENRFKEVMFGDVAMVHQAAEAIINRATLVTVGN